MKKPQIITPDKAKCEQCQRERSLHDELIRIVEHLVTLHGPQVIPPEAIRSPRERRALMRRSPEGWVKIWFEGEETPRQFYEKSMARSRAARAARRADGVHNIVRHTRD